MSKSTEIQEKWQVQGMDCDSCELFIEKAIKKIPGIISAKADKTTGTVLVEFSAKADVQNSKKLLAKYLVGSSYILSATTVEYPPKKSVVVYWSSFAIAGVFIVFFLILQKLHLASIYSPDSLSPFAIFILGLIASLSSCLAVVGGVSLSVASKLQEKKKIVGISSFHIGRILGFALFGGILGGIFSNAITANGNTSILPAFLEFFVAITLLIVGLDSLGVRIPTKLTIPKFVGEKVLSVAESNSIVLATLIGALTFFLPCGFTQAMQFQAAVSGSFWEGVVIMGAFALGTFPALALMSFSSQVGTKIANSSEWKMAMGIVIIFFAILNLLGAGVKFGVIPVWVVTALY